MNLRLPVPFPRIRLPALVRHPRPHQALAGTLAIAFRAAAHRLAVTAPAVSRRVLHDPCPHRIQIDVSRHRPCRLTVLHHHALEVFLPQVALAFRAPVVPAGEALQQRFHKLREIVHPIGEALVNALHVGLAVDRLTLRHQLPRRRQFLGHHRHLGLRIQASQPLQQLGIGQRHLRPRRHLQQDVEMIAHQAVSENPATRKILHHPHVNAELLLILRRKGKAPVHHPRNAVVDGRFFLRIRPRNNPSCSHTRREISRIRQPCKHFLYYFWLFLLCHLNAQGSDRTLHPSPSFGSESTGGTGLGFVCAGSEVHGTQVDF